MGATDLPLLLSAYRRTSRRLGAGAMGRESSVKSGRLPAGPWTRWRRFRADLLRVFPRSSIVLGLPGAPPAMHVDGARRAQPARGRSAPALSVQAPAQERWDRQGLRWAVRGRVNRHQGPGLPGSSTRGRRRSRHPRSSERTRCLAVRFHPCPAHQRPASCRGCPHRCPCPVHQRPASCRDCPHRCPCPAHQRPASCRGCPHRCPCPVHQRPASCRGCPHRCPCPAHQRPASCRGCPHRCPCCLQRMNRWTASRRGSRRHSGPRLRIHHSLRPNHHLIPQIPHRLHQIQRRLHQIHRPRRRNPPPRNGEPPRGNPELPLLAANSGRWPS